MAIQKSLIANTQGYDDFDIEGHPQVLRACVPHGVKKGDRFNVYCGESSKFGAVWLGSVEVSLEAFNAPAEHFAAYLERPCHDVANFYAE